MTEYSFGTVMRLHTALKDLDKVLQDFEEMKKYGITPSNKSYFSYVSPQPIPSLNDDWFPFPPPPPHKKVVGFNTVDKKSREGIGVV